VAASPPHSHAPSLQTAGHASVAHPPAVLPTAQAGDVLPLSPARCAFLFPSNFVGIAARPVLKQTTKEEEEEASDCVTKKKKETNSEKFKNDKERKKKKKKKEKEFNSSYQLLFIRLF
jgi:hypothetical protein